MDWNEFRRIVTDLSRYEPEDVEVPWRARYQGDRLREVANLCVEEWPGDFIEIGCYTGGTTAELAKVARKHGRRVVAVDPWGDDPAVYEKFIERTAEYADIIDVIRLPSQDEEAIAQIQARPLCFVFVDGLHEYGPLLSDIRAVSSCEGIIAVDDINWRPDDLRKAFWDMAKELGRSLYWHPKCREGYLLPCG